MEQYTVTGMSCAACQARVEKAVSKVKGVDTVSVSLLTNSMGVEGDAKASDIIKAVEDAGYGASLKNNRDQKNDNYADAEADALKDRETPVLKRRLALSAVFLAILMYITMGHNMLDFPLPSYFVHNHLGLALTQMLLAGIVMLINSRFFVSGFRSLIAGSPNMDTLVAMGSSVSFGWSLFVLYKMCGIITSGGTNMELMDMYHGELYFESAAMIPALITVGKLLEAMSKGRTTDALKSLLKLAPKTAVVIRDGEEVTVPIEEVMIGDEFIVKAGESVPVDGIVISGAGAVDESALTGESIPVDKAENDQVSAATINRSGYLTCRATRVGEDTTLAQIIHMVSDAAATKAPIAKIADRVSGIFVPSVLALALIVIIGWIIAGASLSEALERGICVLVISCPCALGLATPVAIMVGNGIGAKNGVLFKTGEALEMAGRTQIVALDKTGTITQGAPEVTDVICADAVDEKELMKYASALERMSDHPLAQAVVRYAEGTGLGSDADLKVTDFKELAGNGLMGSVGGCAVRAGNASFITENESGIEIPEAIRSITREKSAEGKTPVFFAADNKLLGAYLIADRIRDDSAEGIRQLKDLGIKVVMLTGDNRNTASAIAGSAGVDEFIAGVLPEGKEEVIRRLQAAGKVCMVGDGINDAPALTRADIGIAIGAGTDVAIDSADIVLMNNSIPDVAAAIRLSRQTLTNIHENLFWAFFYNIICIPLAAGLFVWKMNPMIGAAAMSLSSFTVCMNALRLNLFNIKDASKGRPLRGKTAPDISGIISILNNEEDPRAGSCRIQDDNERNEDMEKTIGIEGMMCAHCEATVKKALEALPFVESAAPDHENNRAVITLSGDMDEAAVKSAIEDKDYTFTGIISA